MKKLLLTTVSAGLISMAGPVLAQSGAAAPGTGASAAGAQTQTETRAGVRPAPAPEMVGETLRGADGQDIGVVQAVGEDYLVVSVGEFLGTAERNVAIPWSEVVVDDKTTGAPLELQTTLTRDQIGNMPAHERAAGATERGDVMPAPPADVVGQTLRGADGEDIGRIQAVDGNNIVVSVGEFLGMGEHNVAIPWSEVVVDDKTTGAPLELQTTLTRDQLRNMPAHERGTGAMDGGATR